MRKLLARILWASLIYSVFYLFNFVLAFHSLWVFERNRVQFQFVSIGIWFWENFLLNFVLAFLTLCKLVSPLSRLGRCPQQSWLRSHWSASYVSNQDTSGRAFGLQARALRTSCGGRRWRGSPPPRCSSSCCSPSCWSTTGSPIWSSGGQTRSGAVCSASPCRSQT